VGTAKLRRWVTPITVSVLLVAITTAIVWLIGPSLQQQHLVFIYFVPTALIAIRYGSISAMCVALASTLAAAYFFYAPRFSFKVENSLELLEIVFFSLLALLASQVVSGFAKDRDVERRRPAVRAATLRRRWRSIGALWRRIRAQG
jgi:K+-sensing histidine kinase KdpD